MATYIEEVQYLLLIDGIGTAFTTSEDVDDTYVGTLGFDSAYPGLAYPGGLPAGIDLRSGMLTTSSANFKIEDIDDSLPVLFGASLDDAEPLIVKVAAGTASLGASLYDKHIGIEQIGSAGERRRHSCVPGFNIGLEHVSANQANVTNLAAAPVSDEPILWEGRRVCLYRLVRTASGGWPDLTDEGTRIAARAWFGTLLGTGTQDQKSWTLRCAGPESWVQGSLGAGVTQVPYPIEVGLQLNEDANEHVLVGWVDLVSLFDETDVERVYAPQTTDTTELSGADSYADVASALNTFLEGLAADNSEGDALDTQGLSRLRYSTQPGDDGVQIRWDRDAGYVGLADRYCLRVRLLASKKVWLTLGYDPSTQNSGVDPVESPEKFALFDLSPLEVDYPAHYLGEFWCATAYAMKKKLEGGTSVPGEHTNNFGFDRRWPPIYPQGANVFDMNATAQTFRLKTLEPTFLASSNAVPLPADPDDPTTALSIADVGTVTHQGLVAFSGPYRDETDPEADVTKISLVARVCWRENSDGSLATDGTYPKLAIYEWPEPRLYGFEDPRPTIWGAWRVPPDDGEPHMMRPILAVEHGNGPDVAGYVLVRMLASTGAAGSWYTDNTYLTAAYGLGGAPHQEPGPNDLALSDIGDENLGRTTDACVDAYALGVPAEMIATGNEQGSFETAITRMADDDLFRCKVALGKVSSSFDVLRSVLSPFGWCFSLAGGRFGVFNATKFEAPPTSVGVITSEDLAGSPGEPLSAVPMQQLRKWASIDVVELQARLNPVTGEFARDETLRSPDPGAMYRAQSITHKVEGAHLIHPLIPNTPGANWISSWLERWRDVCRWWSTKHFEVTLQVPARRHSEFWPGAPVSLTNEWLVNPYGQTYGIVAAPGYVTSRVLNTQDESIQVTCIVNARTLRLYSAAAKVTRYVENEGGVGYRLVCDDDYLGVRAGTSTFDVDGFAEPAWSVAGGNADVEVFAFDGTSWTGGIYGVVSSVNGAVGNCYIQLTGALTGATWKRDQHHIVVLRNAADQSAAWPFAVLSALGNKSGNYEGSNKSPKFTE